MRLFGIQGVAIKKSNPILLFRTSILFVLALVLILGLVSCASIINKKNKDGSPIWTTEIPKNSKYFYGVGKAKLSSTSNSEKAALANAVADLAGKFQATVRECTAVYTSVAEQCVVDAYERILILSTSFTLTEVTKEQEWIASDGTVWFLVSMTESDLIDSYELSANCYLKAIEEKRIVATQKLAKGIRNIETADLSEDAARLIIIEANRRIQEEIAEFEKISSAIDLSSIVKLLKRSSD